MSVDDQISNHSDNRSFEDVLTARFSRRTMMAGSLATAAVAFFGTGEIVEARGRGDGGWGGHGGRGRPQPQPRIGFDPVTNADAPGGKPVPTISDDYEYDVIIPWGTPLFPGVPDISATGGRPDSAANAERQVGIGHDGMWFFPLRGSSRHGVLCLNHEFGGNDHVLGTSSPTSLEQVRISQAVHGVGVVELKERRGRWQAVVPSRYNRRITVNTPVEFDGPAAGSALLGDPARPSFGTVNNCANGHTPWGTYLTCEENFNGYFGWTDPTYVPTAEQGRYGFSTNGFGYGWEDFDPRFDLSDPAYAGEENRFGWVVEIDPMRPDAPPVKHTALGRVKHEGFAFATGRGGRAVGYMGDDERFDYIYKFVSSGNWRSMRARGINPLSDGTLYVARFDDDGSGDWLELSTANPALAGWTREQILTFTRLAADAVGATKMDRPEWTTVAPNGDVYCTLTNNSRRTVADAANPLAPNRNGHIIKWRDADDHVGTTFEWDIFVIAEDTFGTDHSFGSPDGLWADPDGRLFIETDGGQPDTNNQLLVANTATGEIRRLLVGVAGDEITGLTVTPDRRTLFCNTQHPGDGDPALSNFPVMNDPADPSGPVPRDATFVLTRKTGGGCGGTIGS